MDVEDDFDEGAYSDLEDDFNDGPPKKSIKLSGSELYKPPTEDELVAMRDTEIMHANLINLQVAELLKEVSLSDQRRKKIDEYLHSLHDFLMKLPETTSFKMTNFRDNFGDLKVPFHLKPSHTKGNMQCTHPANIQVIGSYLLGTNLKQKMNIDLVLEIPKECMQEKDNLNQRYLRKRAAYLTYVASHLKSCVLVEKLQYSYFLENCQKPILSITPSGKLSKYFTIRLHTCPGESFLKKERFLPLKSNVRLNWFTGIENKDETLQPTPHYNGLILSDMLMVDHLKHMHNLFDSCMAIKDGIKLLKVWLLQKEFNQGHGCFSGFLLSMVVAYMLQKKKINKQMSSFQVVRNVLQFLSTSDWSMQGITMDDSSDLSSFHSAYEVVFVDSSGKMNLCFDLSLLVYKQLRHEAKKSLKTLDNKKDKNSFEQVFMTPTPFIRTFDHILRACKPHQLQMSCEKLDLRNRLPDYGGNAITCALPHLGRFLEQAMGTRVSLISFRGCQYGMWDVTSPPPVWKNPVSSFLFGFSLTPDYSRIIDKGPLAQTPETAVFRQLWGDKSELRKFQDGSIREAVLWDCKSKAERRNLPEKICRHILHLHCGLPAGSFTYIANQVEKILHLQTSSAKSDYLPMLGYVGTGDEVNLRLIHSYNEICTQLRNLKQLPLTVVSLQGTSPALRYTEVYPPSQVCIGKSQVMKTRFKKIQIPDDETAAPPYVHPLEIVCQLEGSGKWPQEVEALRRLKAAFYITFAEELEKIFKKLTCVPTQNFLDIFKNGFVFRIMIAYHREVSIMQTFTTPDGLVKTKTTPQSQELEEKIIHMPRIASVLHGLVQKNAAFGITCRLAKRWINGNMLSNHINEIAIELLCAHLFTNPSPFSEPHSSSVGFLRFLWFLSTFDFQANPLIVNFNDELKEKDTVTISEYFKSNRDTLPLIFIATPKDKTKSIWTRNQPTPVILRRLKSLANISLQNLELNVSTAHNIVDFNSIFSGSLSAYDVVIKLNPKCVARLHEKCQDSGRKMIKDEDISTDNSRILPVAGFDPVQYYLNELEAAFSHIALFFVNCNGGTEIGILWRPGAFSPKDFKINSCFGTSLIDENKVAYNVHTVLEDFKVLGSGIVDEIELRTDKWKL